MPLESTLATDVDHLQCEPPSPRFLEIRDARAVVRPRRQRGACHARDRPLVPLAIHQVQPAGMIDEGERAAASRPPAEGLAGHRRTVDPVADLDAEQAKHDLGFVGVDRVRRVGRLRAAVCKPARKRRWTRTSVRLGDLHPDSRQTGCGEARFARPVRGGPLRRTECDAQLAVVERDDEVMRNRPIFDGLQVERPAVGRPRQPAQITLQCVEIDGTHLRRRRNGQRRDVDRRIDEHLQERKYDCRDNHRLTAATISAYFFRAPFCTQASFDPSVDHAGRSAFFAAGTDTLWRLRSNRNSRPSRSVKAIVPLPAGPHPNINPGTGDSFTNSLMVSPTSISRTTCTFWLSAAFSTFDATFTLEPPSGSDARSAAPAEPVPNFIVSYF